MTNTFSKSLFQEAPLVGIMRDIPAVAMHKIAACYLKAGLTTLEITLNSEEALSTIEALSTQYGAQLNIGAGTVLNVKELDQALSAGAQFIVTPVLKRSVISRCLEKRIPVFPGAYTPTEIHKAWEMGADMVKVFPAAGLGTDYIKDVLAPMRFLKLLPTGGVNLENCRDFFQAGAAGVALGSSLFPKTLIQHEQWDELTRIFEQFRALVQECQSS